ncbi:MAG: glycosyltransferase, partial [Bacilli bacterium]|nr:glycosyltransferase [Bacilli bacterium]
MKTILFIGTDSNLSGATISMITLSKYLIEKGINPIIILPGNGDAEILLKEKNIKYYVIKSYSWVVPIEKRISKKFINIFKYFIKKILNYKAIREIKQIIENEKVDVVHINSLFSYVGAIAAKQKKVKLVWHIREMLEEGHNATLINKNKCYKLISKSDLIITISKCVFNKYKKILNNDNMVIVYNGIDTHKFYNEKKEIFLNKKLTFTLAGTIQDSKGQKELLYALSNLKNDINIEFETLLIGYGNEKNINYLNELIIKLNLENEVKYLGFKKNIEEYWNQTDIAFMCSNGEAFGRTTVEAMLSGCLVIGADIAATSELIEDKKTGFLYISGDSKDLKDKILYALNNTDLCKKIASDAKENA